MSTTYAPATVSLDGKVGYDLWSIGPWDEMALVKAVTRASLLLLWIFVGRDMEPLWPGLRKPVTLTVRNTIGSEAGMVSRWNALGLPYQLHQCYTMSRLAYSRQSCPVLCQSSASRTPSVHLGKRTSHPPQPSPSPQPSSC